MEEKDRNPEPNSATDEEDETENKGAPG